MKKLRTFQKLFFTLLIVLITTNYTKATWSIIAVDRKTGEIGIAGASCTGDVRGIGSYVPGKGVVVVQAMSNSDARRLAVKMIKEGAKPKEIIEAMRNEQFDPENQQYGIVILEDNFSPETYSGKQISDWNGAKTGVDFAVLGNILVDENVINEAFKAFSTARDKSLSERLMLALEAGAKAGGDKRCGNQHATSAFMTVYKSNDYVNDPYVSLYIYGMERGGESAVLLLLKEYERWEKVYKNNQCTQVWIIPEKNN